MANMGTYKDGGSGKGQVIREGLDLSKFGENLDKTKGTKPDRCLDCRYFEGINCADIVTCVITKNHRGLTPCKDFFK